MQRSMQRPMQRSTRADSFGQSPWTQSEHDLYRWYSPHKKRMVGTLNNGTPAPSSSCAWIISSSAVDTASYHSLFSACSHSEQNCKRCLDALLLQL